MSRLLLPFGTKFIYGVNMKIFCERLKDLRKENNLSTMQLAKILGVGDSTISRWENGLRVPNIDNLYNIAIFFNVSSDYLIGLEK